jgi:hypothetical protein
MRINVKKCVWVLAVVLGIGTAIRPIRAAAYPLPQEQAHDQDYSKTKTYQQGLRDGQDDNKHNKDHSKKRHFKKDDDQKAYESGYQQGRNTDQRK